MSRDSVLEHIDKGVTSIRITPHKRLRDTFLRDNAFTVQYETETEGLDLRQVKDSVAIVPFLFNIAPIIWASGMYYSVECIDRQTLVSLNHIKRVLRHLYPQLGWAGELTPSKVVPRHSAPTETSAGRALLFSGGVDSTYSLLRHWDEALMLVFVAGADIALENREAWAEFKNNAFQLAQEHQLSAMLVASNFKSCLRYDRLDALLPRGMTWWSNIQFGVGLPSLTIPALAALGRREILEAGDGTAPDAAWASNPNLVCGVRAGGVKCVLSHGTVSRLEKIRYIVQNVAPDDQVEVRVCWSNTNAPHRNCGQCEKCLRTMAAIVLHGGDPCHYGFDADSEETFRRIVRAFSRRRFWMSSHVTAMWLEMQEEAARGFSPMRADARASLRRWLVSFDFNRYAKNVRRRRDRRRRLVEALRAVPLAYKVARGLKEWLKSAGGWRKTRTLHSCRHGER